MAREALNPQLQEEEKSSLPKTGDYIQAAVTIGGFEKHSYTGTVKRIRKTPRGWWIDLTTEQTFPAESGDGMKVEVKNFGKVPRRS